MGGLDLGKFLTYILILGIVVVVIIYNFTQLGFESGSSIFDEEDVKAANEGIKKADSYPELEEALEAATKRYIDKYYPELSTKDLFIIQIGNLVDEGYIDKVKDPHNFLISCGGYVTVYNNNNSINYDAFIKCGIFYETPEFSKRYHEQNV